MLRQLEPTLSANALSAEDIEKPSHGLDGVAVKVSSGQLVNSVCACVRGG